MPVIKVGRLRDRPHRFPPASGGTRRVGRAHRVFPEAFPHACQTVLGRLLRVSGHLACVDWHSFFRQEHGFLIRKIPQFEEFPSFNNPAGGHTDVAIKFECFILCKLLVLLQIPIFVGAELSSFGGQNIVDWYQR